MSAQPGFKQTEIGMIPEDWKVKTLEDVCEKRRGSIISGPFGSNIGSRFFVSEGIPVIRGNNVTTDFNKLVDDGFVFITEEKANELNTWADEDDLVFTAAGTLGQIGIIPKERRFRRYIISNKQLRARLDKNQMLPIFAFYWFKTHKMVQYITVRSTGSTIPLINLSVLKSLPIPCPELREQEAIAKILNDLDCKIELNQQMNKTLEAIGQAIFRHWFVDFEFPNEEGKPYRSSGGEMVYNEDLGQEIPKAWQVGSIDEIANFLNGLPLQNYPPVDETDFLPVIKIRELRQGITDSTDKASRSVPEEYVIHDGDVLFSWSGSLEVVIWTFGDGALNQHLFKVTSRDYPKWFYYHWILRHLPEYRRIAEGKATTMGHIQRHHLKNSLVLVPDQATLHRMDKIQSPIIEKLIRIGVESRSLSQIRDTLLPKLMSGKVRVPVEVR